MACFETIRQHGSQFDYILSHTGTTEAIAYIEADYQNEERLPELHQDSTVLFNDEVAASVSFKKWLFGHWHSDWGYEHRAESRFIPLYHKGELTP